jgi:hypothetical protein
MRCGRGDKTAAANSLKLGFVDKQREQNATRRIWLRQAPITRETKRSKGGKAAIALWGMMPFMLGSKDVIARRGHPNEESITKLAEAKQASAMLRNRDPVHNWRTMSSCILFSVDQGVRDCSEETHRCRNTTMGTPTHNTVAEATEKTPIIPSIKLRE